MDSQSDKASSQAPSTSGMSFSGFSFQKKASQSRVKLEAGASLDGGGDGERDRGRGADEGKDYVLSLEGKTIHRLAGWYPRIYTNAIFPLVVCNFFYTTINVEKNGC